MALVLGPQCLCLKGATPRTMPCCCKRTIPTVMVAVALATGVPAFLPSARPGPEEGSGEAGPASAD